MLALVLVAVPVLQGCGGGVSNWSGTGLSPTGGGGPGAQWSAGVVGKSAVVAAVPGKSYSQLSGYSAQGPGLALDSGGNTQIGVTDQVPQVVFVGTQASPTGDRQAGVTQHCYYLALNIPGQSGIGTVGPESTATALAFMNPFLCTTDPNRAKTICSTIQSQTQYKDSVDRINSDIRDGKWDLDALTPDQSAMVGDLVLATFRSLQSTARSRGLSVGIDPSTEQSLLTVTSDEPSAPDSNTLSARLNVRNRAYRYVSPKWTSTADNAGGGLNMDTFLYTVSSCPPSVGDWSALAGYVTNGNLDNVNSFTLTTKQTAPDVRLDFYGPGLGNAADLGSDVLHGSSAEVVLPCVLFLMNNLFDPVVSILTGIDVAFRHLSQIINTNSDLLSAVKQMVNTLQTLDKVEDVMLIESFILGLADALRTGDLPGYALEASQKMIQFFQWVFEEAYQDLVGHQAIEHPLCRAVWLVVKHAAGSDLVGALKGLLGNWFWPLKVLGALTGAVDFGRALGAFLVTNAKTTFDVHFSMTGGAVVTVTLPSAVRQLPPGLLILPRGVH